MNEMCGRFRFVQDMNGDGIYSISDFWLQIKFLWNLPAKAVVGVAANFPEVTKYFEIACSTGEDWGGAVFSLPFWWLVAMTIWAQIEIRAEEKRVKRLQNLK